MIPMIGTGHLPDMAMITPIFQQGKVVAYAGTIAHMPDIGGRPIFAGFHRHLRGGHALSDPEALQGWQADADVFDIIGASVRLPREVLGDIESMVAANDVMARELVRFLEEYGLDDVEDLGARHPQPVGSPYASGDLALADRRIQLRGHARRL